MLGIILSGANSDGAEGMFKCKQRGGYTIVQDPEEATVKTMVSSTLALIKPNKVLSTDEITAFLNALP
jgi:two-component system chemotaxis response regulator CheB